MNITDKNLEKYIKAFENHFNGESRQHFHTIRKNALEKAAQLGFPTTKQEEWRFTNPAQIAKGDFKIAGKGGIHGISQEDIAPYQIENWQGSRLVFIDGFFSELLSDIKDISGITITSLSHNLDNNDETAAMVSSIADFQEEVFVALNTAFTNDGCVIKVAAGTVAEENIHIMHLVSAPAALSTNRTMIVLEQSARATIIETFNCLSDAGGLVNTVTEIDLAENARMNHYKLQDESVNHFHIGNTAVRQQANSSFTSLSFDFGGKLVRNNITSLLDGEGISCVLNGLYLAEGEQHIDNHTFLDHAKARCESHELYRGILNDNAKGVFSGKIMVRQDAQKTDAKQSNNCLLLSDSARIDAKPQLEIYADDVKCTHGATIGQLDEQAIGYLRSRGIPHRKAVQMLTYAFAEEIIIGIEDEPFRVKVEKRLLQSLNK